MFLGALRVNVDARLCINNLCELTRKGVMAMRFGRQILIDYNNIGKLYTCQKVLIVLLLNICFCFVMIET